MPKVRVQLLTFAGCPLAAAARRQLELALIQCGLPNYDEIDLDDPSTPATLCGWGSPTILIDGVEITGQKKGAALSCRVYATVEKVPMASAIAAAIESHLRRS